MGNAHRGFSARIGDGDLRLLRIFCTVAERGGFSTAESELQMGLPAISRAIRDLEVRLGLRLCRRGRSGFALTKDGQQVQAASLQLLADLERFELGIRSLRAELCGAIAIGIVDTLITDEAFRIPTLLKTFKTRHPEIQINLTVRTSNLIEQAVIDGSLDAGLIVGRRRIRQLVHRLLYRETSHLYCSAGHPLVRHHGDAIRVEHLSECDFVGYTAVSEIGRLRTGPAFRRTALVDHMEAAAILIGTDCFIGYLPDHYAEAMAPRARFIRLLEDDFAFHSDVELVTRRGPGSPVLAAFLAQLDAWTSRASSPDA
ncbi:LysR family transcriptional regulator [Mycobacterium sp. KBS0706]|uniref:LysR family transcriptional regulator n=1 Tax=Mycobacterium sp. KBS0706 TaxID=2578109 RepID=UPI00163DC8B6|nr:LysR family transcriptional regulator [Mycobacterium sp. KBS0706]